MARKVFQQGRVTSAPSGGAKFVKIEDGKPVDLVLLAGTAKMISFNQHAFWRDEGNSPIFPCIVDGCPGCERGDRPKFKAVLPVIVLGGDSKDPTIWSFGISVARMLQDMEEATGSDLAGQSVRVKRTGTGLKTKYTVVSLGKKYNISKHKVDFDEIMSQLGPTTREEIIALLDGESSDEPEPKEPKDEAPGLEEEVTDDEIEAEF